MLDTGSTFHFTGKVGEGGIIDAPPVNVTTAAGEEAFNFGETTIENSQVGSLKAKFAPGALSAAGMGKLLKDLRLDFAWSWRDFENPLLVNEDCFT